MQTEPERKVSFLLGLGIFLMPYIFSWFTLRHGYSIVSRVISFVWLSALVLSLVLNPPKNQISSSTSPDGKKATLVETDSEPVSSVSWQQIDAIYDLKSKTTDIQKKEAWKNFKGKKVVWSGEVSEVSKGLLSGLTLQVKMDEDTFTSDLLIRLKKSEKDKASRLSKGDRVTFSGTLDDWGTIMPITLDDGEILR